MKSKNIIMMLLCVLIFDLHSQAQNKKTISLEDINAIPQWQSNLQTKLIKCKANREKSLNEELDKSYRYKVNVYINVLESVFTPNFHGNIIHTSMGDMCSDMNVFDPDRDLECTGESDYFKDNECNLIQLLRKKKYKEFLALVSGHLSSCNTPTGIDNIKLKEEISYREAERRMHFSRITSEKYFSHAFWSMGSVYPLQPEYKIPTLHVNDYIRAIHKPEKLKTDELFQLAVSNLTSSGPYKKITSQYQLEHNRVFEEKPDMIPVKENAYNLIQMVLQRKDCKRYYLAYAYYIIGLYEKAEAIEQNDTEKMRNALQTMRKTYNTDYPSKSVADREMMQASLVSEIADACLHLAIMDPQHQDDYYAVAVNKYFDFLRDNKYVDEAGSF